jgi:hypothetical protein
MSKDKKKVKSRWIAKDRVAASLTIHHARRMTRKGRIALVDWLCKQAEFLTDNHANMADRFTARYRY